MTPVRKWKLISLVLAGCLSYSWWHGDAHSSASATKQARLKGPVRVSAAALGISTEELVRQLFAAKEVEEVRALAEKLGMIGDDDAIDAVMPLVQDERSGVPEAIIAAFGVIATDHAVDVLIKTVDDARDDVRAAALAALGATHSKRAEPALIEAAQQDGAAQSAAVYALGELGTERAVEVLAQLASHPTEIAATAVGVLSTIELPSAKAAIIALVDSPSLTVAGVAIRALRDPDDAMVAKLVQIVNRGESELVSSALGALAEAGERGLPALKQAALGGASTDVRVSAMLAMTDIESPQVLETLRSILDSEEGRLAQTAASAISEIDSDEAREILISAALSDRASDIGAVEYLMRQSGPEVEQALLVIGKSESKERWDAIQHLVTGGNAEALALAVGEARGGKDETAKLAAMEALAGAASQPAIDSLIEIVRNAGELKPRALAILADARPDDPVVAKLLGDAVQSRDPEEAAAAAAALSKVGSEDARDALVAALGSTDAQVARNAASSLSKFRLTDDMTAALKSTVVAHPELKIQVMQQLVASGSPYGVELAKQAISGEDANEAYRAISALESSGSPAAFDVLAIGARAKDAQVRVEAINSLGNLGDKRAVEIATQAIRDPEPSVRYAAVRALGQTGTQQARDTIVNLSRSGDVDDRRAAVSTMRRFEDANTTRRLTELLRDPDPSVAYGAIDAAAERPEALPAIKSLVADANLSYSIRRDAAQALSYRGISDPTIEALLGGEGY